MQQQQLVLVANIVIRGLLFIIIAILLGGSDGERLFAILLNFAPATKCATHPAKYLRHCSGASLSATLINVIKLLMYAASHLMSGRSSTERDKLLAVVATSQFTVSRSFLMEEQQSNY